MILRAKNGISKIAELQFYFSAELGVATTNCQKVPESAGDHGVFAFLIVQLRLSFKLNQLWRSSHTLKTPILDWSKGIYNVSPWVCGGGGWGVNN